MSILRRGYSASRLKSQLIMAVSRLSVATNKKSALMGQATLEVRNLLEENPPRMELAMIRAESLMRDESAIEAYGVLGLKCELLSERINLISSSKTCPADMVECISSVMWSSSVLDMPELVEVRKQFRYKYGSEFEKNALRSGGGGKSVNERVANGLSYRQPSSSEVMAYLENIAIVHGLAWRPMAEATTAAEVMREPTNTNAGRGEERTRHRRREGEGDRGPSIVQCASAPPMPQIVGTATLTTAMWEERPSKFDDEDDIQEGDIFVTPITRGYLPGACATSPPPSVSNDDDDDDGPGEAAAGISEVRLDDAVEEPAPPRKTEDDDSLCVMCIDSKKQVILMPCKHMCLCRGCAAECLFKTLNECPMCRAEIVDSMQVFW